LSFSLFYCVSRLKFVKKVVFCIVLLFVLFCGLVSVFNVLPVKAQLETIYIRANGSVEPSEVPILNVGNVTYTFTDDVNAPIVVERSNIIIDGNGYKLQGTGSGCGFNLTQVNNVTVRKTNIHNFSFGVVLRHSSYNLVCENNMTNRAYGVWLWWSPNNTILENNIADNPTIGIRLEVSSNVTVSGNNVTGNGYGVFISWSSYNIVCNNNIVDNNEGIFVRSFCDFNLFFGNRIEGNIEGFHVEKSNNNTIFENDIIGNSLGIDVYIFCTYTSFFHNNIVNNNKQALTSYTMQGLVWDNGVEGNYWSNYTSMDLDGDGIGDNPHVIDESNQDNFPLMNPFVSGDCDHDGIVNVKDASLLGLAWLSQQGEENYNPHVDFNLDRTINIQDASVIEANWQRCWEG